jgi:hypothetical protein
MALERYRELHAQAPGAGGLFGSREPKIADLKFATYRYNVGFAIGKSDSSTSGPGQPMPQRTTRHFTARTAHQMFAHTSCPWGPAGLPIVALPA